MRLIEELSVEAHGRLLHKLSSIGQQNVDNEDEDVDEINNKLLHAFEDVVQVSKEDLKPLSKTIADLVKLASPISRRLGELVNEIAPAEAWLKNAITHALGEQVKVAVQDAFCTRPLLGLFVFDNDESDESESESDSESVEDDISLSSSEEGGGEEEAVRKRPRDSV